MKSPGLLGIRRHSPNRAMAIPMRSLAAALPLALTLIFSTASPAPAAGPVSVLSAAAPAPDNAPRGPRIYKLP